MRIMELGDWWPDAAVLDDGVVGNPSVDMTEKVRGFISEWRSRREPLPKSNIKRLAVGRLLHLYDADVCGICCKAIVLGLPRFHPGRLQLDHVIPRAAFGLDTWDNIQITHGQCNAIKKDSDQGALSPGYAAELRQIATLHFENPVKHRDLARNRYLQLRKEMELHRAEIFAQREFIYPIEGEEVLEVDHSYWAAMSESHAQLKIWSQLEKQIRRDGIEAQS